MMRILKPQNTVNYEAGIDLHLFNSRIKMEYTYSLQNVKDQIFSVPTDGAIGYQYMMTNAGKMRTHAHEFSINAAILQSKDYDLNLGINFTRILNKVIELAPGVESIMLVDLLSRRLEHRLDVLILISMVLHSSVIAKETCYCLMAYHKQQEIART